MASSKTKALTRIKDGYHEGHIKAPSGKLFKITKPTVTGHHIINKEHK